MLNIMKHILLTLLTLTLAGCDNLETYKNKPIDDVDLLINQRLEAKHPNLKPMYGDKLKSSEEIAIDNKYVEEVLLLHNGDKLKAVKESARDGWHYFFKEKMDTAMFRFNQSWLIDKNYPASYFGFAAIREYQGLKDEAEKYFEMGYKQDPYDSLTKKYLHQIAQIREEHNDTLELINAYYRVLSKFPKDGVAAGKLGFFYSELNKPDSALKYYNLTIEIDPEYEQTYLNRAWLFYERGEFDSAIADYTTVIDKNNLSIYAFANLGNVLMDNNQYQLAIADINRCIELDPTHPNFHFAKAECYHQLKRDNDACDEIRIGIKKGGKYTEKLKEFKCE
jgi:tetratricopeptide (TPR) repeat protein